MLFTSHQKMKQQHIINGFTFHCHPQWRSQVRMLYNEGHHWGHTQIDNALVYGVGCLVHSGSLNVVTMNQIQIHVANKFPESVSESS